MIRRLLLTLFVSFAGVLALAGPASAHNSLVSSDPADGSSVAVAPTQLTLMFDKSVPLDTLSIEMIDASGVRSDLTGSVHGPNGDTHVVTPLPALPAGAVNLRWRLVGPDGHPITGRIGFTIAAAATTSTIPAVVEPGAPTTATPIVTLPAVPPDGAAAGQPDDGFTAPWTTPGSTRWFLRLVSYVAIMAIGGVIATMFFVWPMAWMQRVIQKAVAISVAAAFVAAVAQLLIVASDIGGKAPWDSTGTLSAAFETDAGVALLLRLLLLALLALVMFSMKRSVEALRWKASALIVLVLLGTWAYAGHSQSMRWALLGMPLDVAHHAAAAAWLGGLAIVGLVVTKSTERDELVDVVQRFGRLAAVSVAVIIGTGLLQAIRLVGSPTRLFAADHGQYLVLKLVFLGVMLKVADINRQRVGRRFREPTTATPRLTGILRRAMGTELVVGLAVIGVTAAMVVSPPAIAQQDVVPASASPDGSEVAASVTTSSIAASLPIDGTTTTTAVSSVAAVPAQPCVIEAAALRSGATGASVVCLQQALIVHGAYSGEPSGQFDQLTDDAVRSIQQQRGLIIDGIVGRETATALGIWPQS